MKVLGPKIWVITTKNEGYGFPWQLVHLPPQDIHVSYICALPEVVISKEVVAKLLDSGARVDPPSTGGSFLDQTSEKIPGWLGYIGDYTTQLYRDYNKPLQGSLLTNQYNGK